MKIEKLDHVNLRTKRLGVLVEWYETVLGLRSGARPDFPFPGAWLYAGDQALVHIVGISGDQGVGSESALKLEHFALCARGRVEFVERLESMGEDYRRFDIEDFNIIQINIWDPDGNHIHIDFPADE